MSIQPYVQGYPPDQSTLGQTKSTIRNNLDGTFLTVGIDHVNNNGLTSTGISAQPAGYHNVIHMVSQTQAPTTPGYGQLFATSINSVIADTALQWKTGSGLVIQLTSNVVPVSSQNGYSFLPGGILMQWGLNNDTNQTGTLNFNIPFQTAVFVVLLTPTVSSTTNHANGMYWQPTPGDLDKFRWYQADRATSQTGFSWIAIGN